MNRFIHNRIPRHIGVPYMCGDEPAQAVALVAVAMRSLHVWG